MPGITETIMVCASLIVIDGDSLRCDGQLLRLLGEGVPFVSGVDTPEIGSHAKCDKERKLALLAKHRLKEIIAGGVTIVDSGYRDKTPKRRPLVNVYDSDGEEVGQRLMREGFAREWRKGKRNDWCR